MEKRRRKNWLQRWPNERRILTLHGKKRLVASLLEQGAKVSAKLREETRAKHIHHQFAIVFAGFDVGA